MKIVEFNAMEASTAGAFVRACASIESFVAGVVGARPYPDATALLQHAEHLALRWTPAEVDEALADHPRIGERHAAGGASASLSDAEQAAVSLAGDVRGRLAEANQRYEDRFGRIYLVRARGRDAEELLALLEERLTNDDATEAQVVRQQLAEIAMLRLVDLFEEAA